MPVVRSSGVTAGLPAPLSPRLRDTLNSLRPGLFQLGLAGDPVFSAAAQVPEFRKRITAAIDGTARERDIKSLKYRDVTIVGGGLHAAIFAAAYWKKTGRKPLVLEKRPYLGGVFGIAGGPVFYLNSRNRPDTGRDLFGPGTAAPLNTVGGLIEVSDISGREYPTQDDLAYVIKVTLALYASPISAADVRLVATKRDGTHEVVIEKDEYQRTIASENVVIATGVGEPERKFLGSDARSFDDFLRLVDETETPIRQFGKRVAVIGAGDAGSCVVEYLLGQGPTTKRDTASTAFPERIVWYGQSCRTREEYMNGARSRYSGIGRYMPRQDDPDYYARVIARPRALRVYNSSNKPGKTVLYRDPAPFGEAIISEPYDSVILCAGYENRFDRLTLRDQRKRVDPVEIDGLVCATRVVGTNIYRVGPCAELPVSEMEKEENRILEKVPQNSVALFRYNRRTMRLAEALADAEA